MASAQLRRSWVYVVLAVLGVCGLVALLVSASVNKGWRAIEDYAVESRLEWEARDFNRAPLWGEATPGLAFEHYREAIERATRRLETDEEVLLALLQERDGVTETQRAAFRADWAPILAAVREGAHRSDARPDVRPERGYANPSQRLMTTRYIVNAAIIEARILRDTGRDLEAVRVCLDAATFGADVTRSPMFIDKMVGTALVGISLADYAWPDAALRKLDDEALATFAEGLARLDAALPHTLPFEEQLMLLSNHFVGAELPFFDSDVWSSAGWRHAYCERWLLVDTFRELAHVTLRLATSESAPWPERLAQLEQSEEELSSHFNAHLWAHRWTHEHSLRWNLTSVRLLRLAVDAHLGRELQPLGAPLGAGALTIHTTDTGRRFASEASFRDGHLERVVVAP